MTNKRRIISLSLAALLLLCLLTSCIGNDLTQVKCKVGFYINGEEYEIKEVTLGSTVMLPDTPKREGYIFTGWYLDPECTRPFDFSLPVLTTTVLYGDIVPDAEAVTRLISDKIMSAVVTVYNKAYNTMGGIIETESATSQGSGVVIDISGGYAYVLTNCHVAEPNKDYSHHRITVEDAQGNSYEARLYKHPNKTEQAISEKYDLALICFEYKTDMGLTEIALGEDPKEFEYIVSIGTPEGKKNTLVFGEAIEYRDISKDDNESFKEMTFDALLHTGALGHGSSGGPLVDMTGALVGINFAGVEDSAFGFAIPISTVREFLDIYVYDR